MTGLLLKAVDVVDGLRWRWLLVDEASGAPLADHRVAIDPESAEAEAFADLHRYVRWHADPDPDRRAASEASIVDRIGAWIGREVLGDALGQAIVGAAPVTVRVRAGFLLHAPLELAHVHGTALALREDVTLVHDLGADDTAPDPAQRDHLRMVAVFSLPTDTTALALRRERYELSHLVRRIAARSARRVHLEILQYGVTREVLRERMTAAGGPDILHLSGHGGAGLVMLETGDGRADPVTTAELLHLLRPARKRLRLAVLSACESAAVTTAETLRWLKLAQAAAQTHDGAEAAPGPGPLTGLAREVAHRLGCAVVAMRFPVLDEFAIGLSGALYEGLFALDLLLDHALRRAVAAAARELPFPHAISLATPALVGSAAIGMTLTPPHGTPDLDPAGQRMAGFPDEPRRFVGRAAAMARAGRALAPGSGHGAVLFHGMAGAGKTACALELAYRHRFAQAAWWQAPQRDEEWPTALTTFAVACEAQLPGFTMVDKLTPAAAFDRFLPRLRTLLRDNGILVVLDNLETLLTPAGVWRDPRWGALIDVLTGHGGESRTVLTSRIRPARLSPTVHIEPVHALSRDETVLLARELPHLRRLIHGDQAAVVRLLRLVQGHPKLLELADAAAAQPETLAAHLSAARDDPTLAAFLTHGESTLDANGMLRILAGWTTTTMATLPAPAQLLAQMLAGMEEADRDADVLRHTWPSLCHRLGSAHTELHDALAPLTAAALVDARSKRYELHPGIAETLRATTAARVREAVDLELASFWWAVTKHDEADSGHNVRAGLSAAPYMLRRRDWHAAALMIQGAINHDYTDRVAQIAMAHLRRTAAESGLSAHLGLLGKVTARIDPVEGERLLRTAIDQASRRGEHSVASALTGFLADRMRESGRLHEALALADRLTEADDRAGADAWTRLSHQALRLQIRYRMGHLEQVLTEVRRYVAQAQRLPDDNTRVLAWNVREILLSVGAFAARELGRWEEALDFNRAFVASLTARGMGPHAIAFAEYNSSGPLLELGRFAEAERLLLRCQAILEAHDDLVRLASVLDTRGTLAAKRGRHREAIELAHTALRLVYLGCDPDTARVLHRNLAAHLGRARAEPAARLAHGIAAAVISRIMGQTAMLQGALEALADDLHVLAGVAPPATIAGVAAIVERVEGVRFTELLDTLSGDPQEALDAVLAAATPSCAR